MLCFFLKFLESLPPLLRQHSAAIGCTKNYQPIGMTVHQRCVESFDGLLQRFRRGRGCSESWKTTIFIEHPQVVLKKTLNLTIACAYNIWKRMCQRLITDYGRQLSGRYFYLYYPNQTYHVVGILLTALKLKSASFVNWMRWIRST